MSVSDVLAEHRHYCGDARRIGAYRRALAEQVRPGDVVLDLGAGTGVLGLMACEAGAGRVYAVDDGPILALAREVARASPWAGRIVHVRGHSSWVELPEPVDVIVSDQVGHFGFEAGLLDVVPRARDRWLKPGGRLVPAMLTLRVAPVSSDRARSLVAFWTTSPGGFDLSAVAGIAASTAHPIEPTPADLLGPAGTMAVCDLLAHTGGLLGGRLDAEVERAGRFDGWLGWFVVELAPGVIATNDPTSGERISRRPLFLPVTPVAVEPGDRIRGAITAEPGSGLLAWATEVHDASGHRRLIDRRSTLGALLLSPEDVRRLSPDARPTLSREGQALAEVLARCDGRHRLSEIERLLADRFPDVFPDAAAAAPFVADLVARHGRQAADLPPR